jgi:DNA-binding GntR family transcriptional regulator
MSATSAARLLPAPRPSLSRAVADSLREAILAGRFVPGQRIGQAAVARELGVSQTTVRDAFATLEHEGLVRRGARQGAAVTKLSRDDIEEIVTLRTALEGMAIRHVVRRATPEQLGLLEDNVRALEASRGAGRVAELDLEFHEMLVRFANHRRLLACWLTLLGPLKLLLLDHNLRDRDSRGKTVRDHRQLLRLIRAGDEAGAVAHVEHGGDVYRLQVLSD